MVLVDYIESLSKRVIGWGWGKRTEEQECLYKSQKQHCSIQSSTLFRRLMEKEQEKRNTPSNLINSIYASASVSHLHHSDVSNH